MGQSRNPLGFRFLKTELSRGTGSGSGEGQGLLHHSNFSVSTSTLSLQTRAVTDHLW